MGKYIGQGNLRENAVINMNNNAALGFVSNGTNKNTDIESVNLLAKHFPGKEFSDNFLLSALADEILVKVLPFSEKVSFSGGEYICQPGDFINYVYFPETAVISEYQILKDGRMIEIAMTGREGAIGLFPVIGSCPVFNWTQVSIKGTALKINSQILKQEVLRNQSFQQIMENFFNNYVRQVSQRAVCNSYHTLEERFCSWLLMLNTRRRSNRLSLTHEQIARFLGAHRPSVTHIAKSLREKKILDYVRGKLLILNRAKMEDIACDCYSDIDVNFDYGAYPGKREIM